MPTCTIILYWEQAVARKQEPRGVPGTIPKKATSDLRHYITEWIAQLGQFRDLGKLTIKGTDPVTRIITNTADTLQKVTLESVHEAFAHKVETSSKTIAE